jgi:hypothetical protein
VNVHKVGCSASCTRYYMYNYRQTFNTGILLVYNRRQAIQCDPWKNNRISLWPRYLD